MRVMITDIALRSHRRTSIRIDRSIYTRREVRGKLGSGEYQIATTVVDGMAGAAEYNAIANSACHQPNRKMPRQLRYVGWDSRRFSPVALRAYSLSRAAPPAARHRYDILALSFDIAIVRERHTTTTLFRTLIESPALARRYTSIDYTTITRNRGPCNNVTFASVFTQL